MDKRLTMAQAVKLVPSGAMLAMGGVTLYRRPMAFTRALIQGYLHKGEPSELTLLAFTAGLESDLLVGAGMVRRVRTCYFGLEIFGFAPMFSYLANRGEIEIVEETEASLAFGLRAQLAGIGFMPGRGWLGTDLPRLRPDVRTVTDPYNGEELMAFPAIRPDVAVIHCLRADLEGNAIIGTNKGIDLELAQVARQVILTTEEIAFDLEHVDLVAPFISAVVEAPGGALPSSCHPLYPMDGSAILDYAEKVSNPQTFQPYRQSLLS